MSPFCGATDTPVLDFRWHFLWVSKPEWALPYSSLVEAYVLHYMFPQIHLWCDTYRPLGSQHGSWAISSTYLRAIGGTWNRELSCRHSQCEIRQTLYRLSYPGLATTHSVRSGRPDALPTELSRLSHHSQCEIRQARCSTDWAILAQPPLTVWDQADALPTELSWLSHHSQCEIRQARCSTDWAIPAQPPLTMWDQADTLPTELSWLSHRSQCEISQMLYRLSYAGSAPQSLL